MPAAVLVAGGDLQDEQGHDDRGRGRHGDHHGGPGPGKPAPGRPVGAVGSAGWRELTGSRGRGQHLPAHPRRGRDRGGRGEPGRRLAQAADFPLARVTAGHMPFEPGTLVRVESIERVGAGQQVEVVVASHEVTFMQSRIRIRPSRMRVLTVPREIPSSSATCGHVYPP
jgi:hypothetical protein